MLTYPLKMLSTVRTLTGLSLSSSICNEINVLWHISMYCVLWHISYFTLRLSPICATFDSWYLAGFERPMKESMIGDFSLLRLPPLCPHHKWMWAANKLFCFRNALTPSSYNNLTFIKTPQIPLLTHYWGI